MVASQVAPGRAVAVAILAIFLFALLPVPFVQAQAVHDVTVRQGEAKFYQTTFAGKPSPFIDSGTLVSTLSVPVRHTGSTPLNNATIYWALSGVDASLARSGCVKVTLPATQADGSPGLAFANMTIETRDLPHGGYNVTINAFTPRPDGNNDCTGTTTRAFSPGATNSCTPGANCLADVNPTDNTITAYFVKDGTLDLRIDEIRWCRGGDIDGACQTEMLDGSTQWNTTFQGGARATRPTFFEVVVRNVGSWQNLRDYGAATQTGFAYELNVTVTGHWINGTHNISRVISTLNGSSEGDGTGTIHLARSEIFDLVNRAGPYNVTVKIDPKRELRFLPGQTVQVGQRNADVMYRDYAGNITAGDLRTDPANPYPYDGLFTIAGNVTFKNVGTAPPLATSGEDDPLIVRYLIYIDNTTQTVFQKSGKFQPGEDGTQTVRYEFAPTSVGTSANYMPPGRHRLIATIETSNTTVELNESNNTFAVDFYVADVSVPTFNGPIKLTSGSVTLPARTTYYPLETFNIFADARDDDNALKVVANFTLDSNASIYRTVELRKQASNYAIGVPDFNFHNFSAVPINGTENWTVTVTARDSSGNNATAASVPFRLIAYPLHNASAKDIILVPGEFPEPNKIPWSGTDEPSWRIRVTQGMTGYYGVQSGNPTQTLQQQQNQQNYTGNLAINITTAKNRTFNENGTYWLNETLAVCNRNASAATGGFDNPLQTPACTAQQNTSTDTFTTSFGKTQDGAGPGLWNWSIRITDIAGHTRIINGTTLIEDKAPDIQSHNLSTDSVIPGGNFTVNGNFTDDDDEITAVHVNFTRVNPSDNAYVNLTLTEFVPEPGTGQTFYNYTQTFRTGRHEVFGLGGLFNGTISARDRTGNWNSTSLGQLRVVDQDAPVVTSFGVTPTAAEVDENITIWAKVSDATNVTVKLEIFRTQTSSELLRDVIFLEEALDGTFSTTLNFSREGTHAFRLTPVDSVNLAGQVASGTLIIRDNLGPKFEVRSPTLVLDGTRYGSGTPRIEVVVFDSEGVVPTSVDMKVAGLPVDFAVVPAPGNINGFLITYDVRANKKFAHKDVVEVNLSARDNSTESLDGFLNFSFVVDDVAPIAKVTSVAPSYRDQPSHPLNISLNSRIALAADDNDGLPTTVDSIRYRILGGGPTSAETVYTGPFKINDAPGVYQGPRLYTIQYWAEDAVGNFNRAFNTTTVFVDDTPPALYQFFPQGRAVNATFVDDRVGVNRSVVWYRENTQAYLPLPLTEKDGAWSLTLPEGQKGDTISYYLQVWDRLDNTETFGNASSPYATFRVDNREPSIKVTSPVEGSRVFRSVDLTWEASDIDGDALVFTISYKGPGKAQFTELAKIENTATRRYTLDTATNRFPDGEYTFRIAASDGGFVKLSETTVLIINSARAVGTVAVPKQPLSPGETMLVTAEVTKAEAVVEALVLANGEILTRHPMNDQGKEGDVTANDGIFSVRIPVSSAGDYSIAIFTEYREDGQVKSFTSDPVPFSAKLTPSYLLSNYGAIIAIIGLLAAVGIGVAVFVVVRRR